MRYILHHLDKEKASEIIRYAKNIISEYVYFTADNSFEELDKIYSGWYICKGNDLIPLMYKKTTLAMASFLGKYGLCFEESIKIHFGKDKPEKLRIPILHINAYKHFNHRSDYVKANIDNFVYKDDGDILSFAFANNKGCILHKKYLDLIGREKSLYYQGVVKSFFPDKLLKQNFIENAVCPCCRFSMHKPQTRIITCSNCGAIFKW